jgi:hypothetical protein
MASKRMFAKTIIDSDAFLEMPQSTQLLYFHLSMHADDDGFVNSPRKIMRTVGSKDDDIKVLIAKAFIIPFESGIVVIKHWRINNIIRSDRYKPTEYIEEKRLLNIKENGAYTLKNTIGIPNDNQLGYQRDTQIRLDKDRLDKNIQEDSTRSNICSLFSSLFLEFYKLYPRKISKKKTQEKYTAILKAEKTRDGINAKAKEILAGLKRYIKLWESTKTEKQFIPHPTTWLNQERWTDEVEIPTPQNKASGNNEKRSMYTDL